MIGKIKTFINKIYTVIRVNFRDFVHCAEKYKPGKIVTFRSFLITGNTDKAMDNIRGWYNGRLDPMPVINSIRTHGFVYSIGTYGPLIVISPRREATKYEEGCLAIPAWSLCLYDPKIKRRQTKVEVD